MSGGAPSGFGPRWTEAEPWDRDPRARPPTDPTADGTDSAGPPPLFVERQTYRLRRVRDAARAWPVLGLLLWCVPLLWSIPGTTVPASSVLIYIFLSWSVLGVGAAALLWALGRAEQRAARHEARKTREGGALGDEAGP